MVVGVLGAIAQDDVKRILSFNIVSQIGYMMMGLGLFTVAGLAAAVFYIVHHIVVKTTLFLTGGLIEHVGGSSRLSRLGGMVRTAPVVAVLFLVPALRLAGIPPFSGFVAKFALVEAGTADTRVRASSAWPSLVSLLTLFSMIKIWIGVFWSPADRAAREPAAPGRPARRPGADGRPDGAAGRPRARHRRGRRAAVPLQRASGGRPARPGHVHHDGARAMKRYLLALWLVVAWVACGAA